MPRKVTHEVVGTLTGGGFAAYKARDQKPSVAALEVIGGTIFGNISSRLPDVIEPSKLYGPNHRRFAHSVAAGGAISFATYEWLDKWQEFCRSQAEYYHSKKDEDGVNGVEKFLYSLLEILSYLASGALAGLSAGYLSHLALDCFFSSKSLPLIE
jgi:hypothetical protein